jgi:hypothetical protein
MFILAMLVAFSPWLITGLMEDVPLKWILGFSVASRTHAEQLTLLRLLIWVLLYVCYYVLVAAPVFNLLLASFSHIEFKRWREGLGRLVFQTLALMAGFLTAVVRHSWRAYYNLEGPSTLMGRYLIYFSVLYFVIAVIFLARFDRSCIKHPVRFIMLSTILPFLLIVFSYLTLVQGSIVKTYGDLLKDIGSVDGSLIKNLGPWFFVLVGLLFTLETVLLLRDCKKQLMPVLTGGLILYYLLGVPSYWQDLREYQTYPWLAQQISELLPQLDLKTANMEKITVFLPFEHDAKNGTEIYNGLRVRGINGTQVLTESRDTLEDMANDTGFIIQKIDSAQDAPAGQKIYEFNGEYFTLQKIQR